MNNLFGYSLYNEVHEPLCSFNRVVMVKNIKESHGDEMALEYIDQLDDKESMKLFITAIDMKNRGHETVRKEVMNG